MGRHSVNSSVMGAFLFGAGKFLPMVLLVALVGAGCVQEQSNRSQAISPPADWMAWRAKRLESVAGTNGWTTLLTRHWLQEGPTFVGSDPTNQVVLSRLPASFGVFIRKGRTMHFEAAHGVLATIDGQPVKWAPLQSDTNDLPTRLQWGDISFVIIERGPRLGLRVRNADAPTRVHFRGLDYFDYDPAWRIEGRFQAFERPRTLRVLDVVGDTQEFQSPGAIVFRHGGTEHRLEVIEEPGEEDFFVIFRDQTARTMTYPSGRFLYVARPDTSGRVIIDFNRAYTPPCGFTAFATCPRPPRQNWLPFEIRAGERAPRGH